MILKVKTFLKKYAYILLPICTLLCLAGFIGSYLFPNEVLDTYAVNVKESEGKDEYIQAFTGSQDEIGYLMETDGRVLKGIQIGISKAGAQLAGANLHYRVYKVDENFIEDGVVSDEAASLDISSMVLLDEGNYDLGSCLDGQYPYLPFNSKDCTGELYITFTYEANGCTDPNPGMFLNQEEITGAKTYVDANVVDGNMKCYYIYTHNTYPFLYDARVMLCIFLATSMCVQFPLLKKKEEVETA